jgi:hypothetical protein
MIEIELHDTTNKKRIHLGTIGEFIAEVVKEIHVAKVTSKLFSRQADPDKLDKEFSFALDRVIQRIRDEHGR